MLSRPDFAQLLSLDLMGRFTTLTRSFAIGQSCVTAGLTLLLNAAYSTTPQNLPTDREPLPSPRPYVRAALSAFGLLSGYDPRITLYLWPQNYGLIRRPIKKDYPKRVNIYIVVNHGAAFTGRADMSHQVAITEQMKQAEAKAWKERRDAARCSIKHEIRQSTAPKFVNKDIPSPLRSFEVSEAANAALDATNE